MIQNEILLYNFDQKEITNIEFNEDQKINYEIKKSQRGITLYQFKADTPLEINLIFADKTKSDKLSLQNFGTYFFYNNRLDQKSDLKIDQRVIISTDLGGTLVGDKEQMKNFFHTWLKNFYFDQRHLLIYNTGRNFENYIQTLQKEQFLQPDWLITRCGSYIYQNINGVFIESTEWTGQAKLGWEPDVIIQEISKIKWLQLKTMSKKEQLEQQQKQQQLLQKSLEVSNLSEGNNEQQQQKQEQIVQNDIQQEIQAKFLRQESVAIDNFDEKSYGFVRCKFVAPKMSLHDEPKQKELLSSVENLYKMNQKFKYFTREKDHCVSVEFIPYSTDKGEALKFILKKCQNASLNDLSSFGDTMNDIGMLVIGKGYLVENSQEDVKEFAKQFNEKQEAGIEQIVISTEKFAGALTKVILEKLSKQKNNKQINNQSEQQQQQQ